MRLWHYKLIPYLPDCKTTKNRRLNQLGGQHRECCVMRGEAWGMNHKIINYVWNYSYFMLCMYHHYVMMELEKRGFIIDKKWENDFYRGKKLKVCGYKKIPGNSVYISFGAYPEHNEEYLDECLNNLKMKGINIDKKLLLFEEPRSKVVTYNYDLVNA